MLIDCAEVRRVFASEECFQQVSDMSTGGALYWKGKR